MREYFVKFSLLICAIVHLLPVIGVLGADKLTKLYGVQLNDDNLILLLRHRAVLFFIISFFCVLSIYSHQLRFVSFFISTLSMGAFICLFLMGNNLNELQEKVFLVDVLAFIVLFIGAYLDGFGFKKFLLLFK